MAYFFPAIVLAFDERIFWKPDHVCPAKLVETAQKRITGRDAIGQECDVLFGRKHHLDTLLQRSCIISPTAIGRVDHKSERYTDRIAGKTDQDQVESIAMGSLVECDEDILSEQNSENPHQKGVIDRFKRQACIANDPLNVELLSGSA